MDLLGLVALSVVVFASTNIDDILILLMFFADRRLRVREIVIGQYLGVGTLIALSLLAAAVALAIPEQYIRFLGLIPLGLGLKKLLDLRNPPLDDASTQNPTNDVSTGTLGRILSVTAVTFANGGDNIGIYTPLFASRGVNDSIIIVTVFLLLIGVWCLIARLLLKHRVIGAALQRYGHMALPVVLIGLGLWILLAH